MRKPICIQRVSDDRNTPVHHIGRSNDIRTGFRLGNGNFRQQFQRGIIIHFMTAELPAVSGISILAETHITYNNKIRKFFFDCHHCPLHRTFHIPGRRTDVIFIRRQPKYFHRRNPETDDFLRLFDRLIHRQMIAAGHTRYFFFHIWPGNNKNRINKVIDFQRRFPYHAADSSSTP